MRLLAVILALTLGVSARDAHVTVLATTDLHGNIYPYDYLSGKPSDRGLAKIATLIQEERKKDPSALLLDAGDTIQGSPLEGLWQGFVHSGRLPMDLKFIGVAPSSDPMMLVMNHLRYDAMTLGNHEFNYGLGNLDRARSEARFPWLSANTKAAAGRKPFQAYVIKIVDGVRVAIVGITTSSIPTWEKRENFQGYTFLDAKAALIKTVAELRSLEKPDLTLVLAHTGLDRDAQSGTLRLGDLRGENVTWQLATQVPGIDAIIFGHTHAQVNELRANGVLLTQPKNWGMSLARLDFFLESSAGGQGWRVKSKSSRVIPVTPQVAADAAVLNLARPYHEVTERYLDSPVAQATSTIDASVSRIEDTPIIDAIQAVQLHYAQADVSFTSSFNPRARIIQGPVTVRQIAGLYIYDNELYAIQGTGLMVRKALENAARYFSTCPDSECRVPSLINRDFIGFNYDVAQGVTYSIDLTKPVGQRIVDLRFKGALLEDARKLRIAVNNYRAGGSGGYDMFKGAPVVWRSYDDIRQLIIQYYSSHGLPSTADGNWRIIPEPAHRKLAQEARALAGRSMTQ